MDQYVAKLAATAVQNEPLSKMLLVSGTSTLTGFR